MRLAWQMKNIMIAPSCEASAAIGPAACHEWGIAAWQANDRVEFKAWLDCLAPGIEEKTIRLAILFHAGSNLGLLEAW